MKLIFCTECYDVFSLLKNLKTCTCGKSHGKFINELDAEIKGNCKVLGFKNSSFREAYFMQDLEDKAQTNKTNCCEGTHFVAFFIPESSNSIKRIL